MEYLKLLVEDNRKKKRNYKEATTITRRPFRLVCLEDMMSANEKEQLQHFSTLVHSKYG